MPNIPQSPLQDGFAVTDADLAALLAGKRDVAPGLQPVADVIAALSTGPSRGELAGEARARAEFRRRTGVPVPRHRARRGTAGLSSRLSAKVAAGAATAAVLMGGAATAAFADVLPAPIQRFAHDAIGAPDAPSAPQHGPARGRTAAPGQLASHGKPAANPKPRNTGRHPNRHGQGQPAIGQGQPATSQGQQGDGQGSPHAQGQAGGQGQGQQGSAQGRGNPHATGQHGNPHQQGQQGNPQPGANPAAHHARPARHRPAMDH